MRSNRSRQAAQAAFSVPAPAVSDKSDEEVAEWPTGTSASTAMLRMRRPDGSTYLLRVPGEHLDRLLALAEGEFGDKSIVGVA